MDRPAERPFKIFALSLDERAKWASLDLRAVPDRPRLFEPLPTSPGMGEFPLPADWSNWTSFEDWLSESLRALNLENSAVFQGRQRIGVSSIGPIKYKALDKNGHLQQKLLVSLPRKPWRQKSGAVVDFNRLLAPFFPDLDLRTNSLIVKNDATAKGLAESEITMNELFPFVYINLDEGFNCGIIVNHGGEFRAALHPEFGHSFPVLHDSEDLLDIHHSGCQKHITCFEGVASGIRIQKRWEIDNPGIFIREVDSDASRQAKEILSWYIAQASYTVSSLVAPRRIVVGGALASETLLSLARRQFLELNRDYLGYDEVKNLATFISLSQIDPVKIDILGAINLAYFGRGNFTLLEWGSNP